MALYEQELRERLLRLHPEHHADHESSIGPVLAKGIETDADLLRALQTLEGEDLLDAIWLVNGLKLTSAVPYLEAIEDQTEDPAVTMAADLALKACRNRVGRLLRTLNSPNMPEDTVLAPIAVEVARTVDPEAYRKVGFFILDATVPEWLRVEVLPYFCTNFRQGCGQDADTIEKAATYLYQAVEGGSETMRLVALSTLACMRTPSTRLWLEEFLPKLKAGEDSSLAVITAAEELLRLSSSAS